MEIIVNKIFFFQSKAHIMKFSSFEFNVLVNSRNWTRHDVCHALFPVFSDENEVKLKRNKKILSNFMKY